MSVLCAEDGAMKKIFGTVTGTQLFNGNHLLKGMYSQHDVYISCRFDESHVTPPPFFPKTGTSISRNTSHPPLPSSNKSTYPVGFCEPQPHVRISAVVTQEVHAFDAAGGRRKFIFAATAHHWFLVVVPHCRHVHDGGHHEIWLETVHTLFLQDIDPVCQKIIERDLGRPVSWKGEGRRGETKEQKRIKKRTKENKKERKEEKRKEKKSREEKRSKREETRRDERREGKEREEKRREEKGREGKGREGKRREEKRREKGREGKRKKRKGEKRSEGKEMEEKRREEKSREGKRREEKEKEEKRREERREGKGREEKEEKEAKGREEKGKEGKRREGKGIGFDRLCS